MSDSELRPEPLRVPVVDVARRQSLAGATPSPVPPAPSAPSSGVVLQRAVRIVFDRITGSASEPPPSGEPLARASSSIPAQPTTPRVRTASVPPPPLNGGEPSKLESSGRQAYSAGSLDEAIESSLREDDGRGARDEYASMEVEPFDAMDLVDELTSTRADGITEEEELDASSIETSVPPPAPAAALRRAASSKDVEITVSYDEDEDDGQDPSVEFEDFDIETSTLRGSDDPLTRSATPLPPSPPSGRLSSLANSGEPQTPPRAARVAEARPSRPRAHPWWEVFFDDDYLRTVRLPTHQQIARQCDFLTKRLGIKPGATVLDVGCGLGLQAVELASRGYLSVGLDLSLAMLSRASEEAQSRGVKINFLHSDMRDMNFEGNFDAVVCIGTSLGYFDDDTNRKVIERMFRALKPNGVLLLDVVNRDHVIRTQPNLIWFEGDGCVCMEESEFNFFTSRLHVKRTVILETGKQRENEYSLRLYSLHEVGQILHQAGFRVIEVSGREALPGVFFGQESPNMMVVAERRSTADGTGKYPALVD